MATGLTTGPMDANTLDSGKMESSTAMGYSPLHQAWKDKGTGRMERGSVGQITSDFM